MIALPLLPVYWDHRCVPPHQVLFSSGAWTQTSWMLDRHSISWVLSSPLLYSSCLAILDTFNPISECQLHEHRFLYDLNSNFLGIYRSVWSRSIWYRLLNGQMQKAKLGCTQTATGLWLIHGYADQNKEWKKKWRGEELRAHTHQRKKDVLLERVYSNLLILRERWSADQE